MNDEAQFPATFTMTWAGHDLHVCPRHGRALVRIACVMGVGQPWFGLLPPQAPEGAQCSNCVNESTHETVRDERGSAASDGVEGLKR